MKKILVTGAAGMIGFQLIKLLLTEGKYEITAFDLKSKNAVNKLKKYKNRINIIYGDITDIDLVNLLVKDQDVIIHLAGVIPPLADLKPELTKMVNYEGTKNLVKAINSNNPNCFFLYSSSITVYGDRLKDYWIDISDPLVENKHDYYAKTKINTESLIKKEIKNYSIFRLTAIMGSPKHDSFMFHMPLDTKLEISSDADTAYAFVKAIEHQKELNKKVFNLGGGEKCRITFRDFLIKVLNIYGLNYSFIKSVVFAEKNFHCGYYKDSDNLENILKYRRDSLKTYFDRLKKETKKSNRFLMRLFSKPIIYILQKKSDSLKARGSNDGKNKKAHIK